MKEKKAMGYWEEHRSAYMFRISIAAAFVITLLKEPCFADSQVYVILLLFFTIGLCFTETIPAFAVSFYRVNTYCSY